MGSSLRKSKTKPEFMSESRNFGLPIGQVTNRDPLSPNLFMRVGTRVGTITAYYQHVNPSSLTPSLPTPQDSSQAAPVVRKPTVRFAPPLELEQTVPLSDPPVYDVPKKSS